MSEHSCNRSRRLGTGEGSRRVCPSGWQRRLEGALEKPELRISWRVLEFAGEVNTDSPAETRREALTRAGAWLGSLPPRLAVEQEDAVRAIADRCGYSCEAVEQAFKARFWSTGHRHSTTGPTLEVPS